MAPKAKAALARMALTTLQQPAQQPARKQQANLHTIEVTVDTVLLDDANGREYHTFVKSRQAKYPLVNNIARTPSWCEG